MSHSIRWKRWGRLPRQRDQWRRALHLGKPCPVCLIALNFAERWLTISRLLWQCQFNHIVVSDSVAGRKQYCMSMGWRWEGLQTASCDHWNLSCSREMAGDSKVSGFGAPSCTSCCLVLAWSRRRHCLLLSDMYVEVNNRMHGHGVFTWADGRTYAWKLSFLSVCIEFLGSPGLLHEGLLFKWFGWKQQPRHNLLVFRCFLLKWNPHWESHPTWNSSNVAPCKEGQYKEVESLADDMSGGNHQSMAGSRKPWAPSFLAAWGRSSLFLSVQSDCSALLQT